MFEILALLIAIFVLTVPVVLLALVIVAFVRTQRISDLQRRIERLEAKLRSEPEPPAVMPLAVAPPVVRAEVVAEPGSPFAAGAVRTASAPGWEFQLGRSVLGWVAVVALVLSAAIFVRYAFTNEWIGPQGQLALILAGGTALVAGGYRYAVRGWRLFSQILFSAAFVVIYLATYGSFGFYHVVSQEVGLVFLLIIVVEAALLALVCEAWPVAFVGLLGGLATPLLIRSPHDQNVSLFAYVLLLNAGTIFILCRRPWPALGTVALLGGQGLFWIWYEQYFHPEKLVWALGFQAALWALHLGYHLGAFVLSSRRATLEDLARLMLAGIFGFGQVYRLLSPEYAPWLGSVAIALAAVYAAAAHLAVRTRPNEERPLLAMLAVVLAFVGIAIPLEARADWVALGWAVLGASLWWFGLRVERGTLRGMGAAVGLIAVLRMVIVDTPFGPREPFWPILNGYALPALGVVACLLGSAVLTWSERRRIAGWERTAGVLAGVAGAALLGWVLSWDLFGWFKVQAGLRGDHNWVWAGQVAVSVLWAAYAAVLLTIGFRFARPVARWLALSLFALTTLKVFFVDMASVGELYRVLALFCLAVVLGGAAWAYSRAVRGLRAA